MKVEQVDPFGGGVFGLVRRLISPSSLMRSFFLETVGRLHQCVVVGVSDGPGGRQGSVVGKGLTEPDRRGLGSVVAVMSRPVTDRMAPVLTLPDGHRDLVPNELIGHRRGDDPAQDPLGEDATANAV